LHESISACLVRFGTQAKYTNFSLVDLTCDAAIDRLLILEFDDHVGVLGCRLSFDLLSSSEPDWSPDQLIRLRNDAAQQSPLHPWRQESFGGDSRDPDGPVHFLFGVVVNLFEGVNKERGREGSQLLVQLLCFELREVIEVNVEILKLGRALEDQVVEKSRESKIIDEIHSEA